MKRPTLLIAFLVTLAWSSLSGQEQLRLERPRIKNFSKQEYKAGNQNWSISQDERGTMYFANNQGLLCFDGMKWSLFPLPDETIVRSVEVVGSDKIFTGSYEEFGFWKRNSSNELEYHSLKSRLQNFQFHNEDIWKIIHHRNTVYFQSFSVIFAYKGDSVQVIRPPGFINAFSQCGNRLLLIIADHGLYELNNERLQLLDSSEFFRKKLIRVLLPHEDEQILVPSADDGIFTYDFKGFLKPWGNENTTSLKNRSINRGVLTRNNLYAIGTILDGMYFFTRDGKLMYHITRENGLQNNTVLSSFIDQDGLLWLGLDNGIDLINPVGNPSFYNDPAGKLGSVYAVHYHQGNLYAGTNQGLFYCPFNPEGGPTSPQFRFIQGSQGQVWSLNEFNGKLICGHNEGSFEVQGNQLIKISTVTGGSPSIHIKADKTEYLLQGSYTDLVVYQFFNGSWKFSHTIANFRNPVSFLERDPSGNIWASHLQRGVFRLKMDKHFTRVMESKYYGREKGFLSDYNIHTYRLQNRVAFTNEGRVYQYDDANDTILPFDFIEKQLRPNSFVKAILPAGESSYWFVNTQSVDLYEFSPGHILLRLSFPAEMFDNKLIQGYENLYMLDPMHCIAGLENGIALLALEEGSSVIKEKKVFISQIVSKGRKEILYIPGIIDIPAKGLPFKQNSIEFHFSCPVFDSPVSFHVYLEGIDKGWMEANQTVWKYDRLPWGKYFFHVKASDGSGNYSQEHMVSVVIRPPWYWNPLSKILYLILLTFSFLVIRRYIMRRLKRQERKMQIEKERELIQLRNEKLESEIHYKSLQLANTTYSIIRKNELLLEIKQLLGKSKKHIDAAGWNQWKEINRLIDQNITDEQDWQAFESNFEQAHEEFLKRIKKQYPELTPSDLKLCAFIRMNLPSKKIASLLGITIRGVENHRYRLRRKMNLEHDLNLTEFLMAF